MSAPLMSWDAVRDWRKQLREEFVARREAVSAAQRQAWNERITERLLDAFPVPANAVVAFCWPYRGEHDPRFAVRRWRDGGASAALPEVVGRGQPLQFRAWRPGVAMRAGVYDIPVPESTPVVTPDVAIVPMNAYDGCGFRLGYGGGFFDATLAAALPRPVSIGVAYECLHVPTIHPQPHDIAMDFVVTESAIYAAGGTPLQNLEPAAARARFGRLLCERALPQSGRRYSSPPCYAADFPEYVSGVRGGDEEPPVEGR